MGVTLISFVGYGGAVWGFSFFIRSFQMSYEETGVFLALVVGIFGATGAILGGKLADHMGAKDVRWAPWIVAVAKLVAAPIILAFFLGFGPQLVGILSDLLEPSYGIESLRYALLLTSFISLWGAYHYYLAGKALGDAKQP